MSNTRHQCRCGAALYAWNAPQSHDWVRTRPEHGLLYAATAADADCTWHWRGASPAHDALTNDGPGLPAELLAYGACQDREGGT